MVDETPSWREKAACRGTDAEQLFADSVQQKRAKALCNGCPVRVECLTEALDARVEFGVWGGMTERERRALLRRRPGVRSWARVLQAAGAAHSVAAG
ncbi:WhiB family transcriptional regulator [Streptomyces sp. NBC_01465]|uniref:WhiB family transcriptional regulator n=1 Tax=Streptomyces sp. NBC_01465 TaxID=2903878 RepID=UPI002E367631|nr:WhiB family transcriptional regulator [Streptomyces sp. NBC_01465]